MTGNRARGSPARRDSARVRPDFFLRNMDRAPWLRSNKTIHCPGPRESRRVIGIPPEPPTSDGHHEVRMRGPKVLKADYGRDDFGLGMASSLGVSDAMGRRAGHLESPLIARSVPWFCAVGSSEWRPVSWPGRPAPVDRPIDRKAGPRNVGPNEQAGLWCFKKPPWRHGRQR